MVIDLERCKRAMLRVSVAGNPAGRGYLIEEAIAAIQADGAAAMSREYFGLKNYAHFGDQRCDCEYGMGPKHGTVVFQIGRNDRRVNHTLGEDEVYFLECVRDFGVVEGSDPRRPDNQGKSLTLPQVIAILEWSGEIHNSMLGHLHGFEPTIHKATP